MHGRKSSETDRKNEMRKEVVDDLQRKGIQRPAGEYDDWDEVVAGSKVILPQAAIDAVMEAR